MTHENGWADDHFTIGQKSIKWKHLKHWALTENYFDQPWFLPLDKENKNFVEQMRAAQLK